MYKAVLIADLHLKWFESIGGINSKGYSIRTIDKFKALKYVCEYCTKHGADLFILGDLFDKPNPSEKLRRAVAKALIKNKNQTYIIGGNHDTSDNLVFSFGSECLLSDRIHLVDQPTILEKEGITLIPWNTDQKLPEKTTDIIFGHLQIEGAQYGNEFLSDSYLSEDVFKGKKFVRLGHIHKRQIHKYYGYIGTLQINDFGEYDNDTGFTLVTIDNGKVTEEFIEYPDRNFMTISCVNLNEDEIVQFVKAENDIQNSIIQNSIIKLKIEGDPVLIGSIGKNRIKHRIKELGALYVKTEYTTKTTITEDAISISNNHRQAFDEYCKKENLSKEYIEFGKEIMEKTEV